MRLLVLTGSIYLILTGLRLFAACLCGMLAGKGCACCPYGGRCRISGKR